ncbi:MAG: TetR/AcrR family transcriptional regulator [Marinilabiliaceae bacterium]|jgi:AcrR family transcriptional regulator|nr:TetR/AcrR family transcriptional regulator [Marinilabiliaceae bacterium]
MSPRTSHQFQEIRKGKRSLIMNVALELFAGEGYHSASISKIASRAGISKGLMYNYFSSKEDLLNSIIQDGLDQLKIMLDPNRDGIITRGEMESFIVLMFDAMKANKKFWTLYFSLMLQPPVIGLVRSRIDEMVKVYIAMLTRYFESLGHEDPGTDAYIFGSLMDGIGFNFIANPDSFPYDRIKKRLIQLYCS